MKRYKSKVLMLAVLAAGFGMPAHATNGYFLPGFGIRSLGMGGVGMALGGDALSSAANPAHLIHVGHRMDVGATLFNPERNSTVWDDSANGVNPFGFSGGGDSDETRFVMPEFGFAMPFTEDVAFGFAMLGNGGMNTTYRSNFFNFKPGSIPGQDFPVGVDLMQLLMPLSAAFKVEEHNTIGISAIFAVQRFAAGGLQAFGFFDTAFGPITANPNQLTNKGYDWSYGFGGKLGWLASYFDDRVTVGAAWASKTNMTRFERYEGLFAEQGDFDIPENYGVGIAVKPLKNLTLAFDVNKILYSDIPSVANRGPNGTNGTSGVPSLANAELETGDPLGMGFGWSNQTIYKFGLEYALNDDLQVRLGYNYGKSPIADDQVTFNTLAPAVVEQHYSVGFTYKLDQDMELTGNYMYAEGRSQQACGQNIIDCAKLYMHQNYFGLNLSILY